VLAKLYAPPKPTDIPVLKDPKTLLDYDGFLMGVPTRYGNFPAQWKTFWDSTGLFITNALQGGGQESTALATMSTLAHHGIIYVPLGSAKTFPLLSNMEAIHGGSPWGAGSFSAVDGQRQPTELEKNMATIQGEEFYKTLARFTGKQ
jgi:NAD(P)H dehydrogenase (quinone)